MRSLLWQATTYNNHILYKLNEKSNFIQFTLEKIDLFGVAISRFSAIFATISIEKYWSMFHEIQFTANEMKHAYILHNYIRHENQKHVYSEQKKIDGKTNQRIWSVISEVKNTISICWSTHWWFSWDHNLKNRKKI